jgi:hypothetical protein
MRNVRQQLKRPRMFLFDIWGMLDSNWNDRKCFCSTDEEWSTPDWMTSLYSTTKRLESDTYVHMYVCVMENIDFALETYVAGICKLSLRYLVKRSRSGYACQEYYLRLCRLKLTYGMGCEIESSHGSFLTPLPWTYCMQENYGVTFECRSPICRK